MLFKRCILSLLFFFFIMLIEVSIGEVLDKLTILEIKLENIKNQDKILLLQKEFTYLQEILQKNIPNSLKSEEYASLKTINSQIWQLEDELRLKTNSNEFDDEYILYSRAIHRNNELRAEIKLAINLKWKSDFVEVKSYN